jgi:hypothetical protein
MRPALALPVAPASRLSFPSKTIWSTILFAIALATGACASQIGLDGIEYDRRLCGADKECNAPSVCRGTTDGSFRCEPAPANAAKFAEKIDKSGAGGASICASGLDLGGVCTRPCRDRSDCGFPLTACSPTALSTDLSRTIGACQAE